jgi:hypothetical protein
MNTIQNRQVRVDVKISGLGFRALNYLITLIGLRLTYIVIYMPRYGPNLKQKHILSPLFVSPLFF